MTDVVSESYNRQCLDGNRKLLDAMSNASARFPEKFHASCGERLLPRPFFVSQAEIVTFTDDLIALIDLLVSLPQRLFEGDLMRYAESLGIDAREAAIMTRLNGRPTLYGRADLYHDGTSFKLLELNLGSELGGTDRAEISRTLLEVDAFRAFAEEHRLGYVHTGQQVASALRKAAEPLTGGADPVVAFVEVDGGLPEYLHLVLSFQEMMRGLGIEVLLGEVSQIRSQGDRLYLHGKPVDVVLRYFTADGLLETADGVRRAEAIFRAHEEGNVVLWTTMQSAIHANKGCLALLSDLGSRDMFSAAEMALVDRVLPWTRTLTDGPVQAEGTTVELLEYCREQRDQLIIKPHASFGGKGIVVGWQTSESKWNNALLECRDQGSIVQRRVTPRKEPVVDPTTGAVEDWVAAWDAFLTPDGYAGSHIRALPSGEGAVIGMGASARCRTTGVFTYPRQE